MIRYLSIILLGFFLGMRHSTDPDHVIAVATIVTRCRRALGAAGVGIVWGIGHTLTVSAVGAGIILFKLAISPRAGLAMELAVGVMLIVLGLANLGGVRRLLPAGGDEDGRVSAGAAMHSHTHCHGNVSAKCRSLASTADSGFRLRAPVRQGGLTPAKRLKLGGVRRLLPAGGGEDGRDSAGAAMRSHIHRRGNVPAKRLNSWRYARPFIVGIVHGLAGSAAVALLVLATIRDPRWAVAYLLLFGAGTIAGMMLITVTMASTFRLVGGGQNWFSRRLRLVSGLVSLAFGLFLAYQICFVQGFLGSSPRWTPQ